MASTPNVPGDVPRELWYAARAFGRRSDELVNMGPFSRARPILNAFSMAADLRSKSAEESALGSHHRREAQDMSLDDAAAPPGGPAKRMKTLTQNARAPAEAREFMGFGGRLAMLWQTDLSLACVGAREKYLGFFFAIST